MTLVAVSLAATALISQEKGGGDETARTTSWPTGRRTPAAPASASARPAGSSPRRPTASSSSSAAACRLSRRYVRHAAGSRPDAQRGRLRSVGQGSRSPSPMGSRPLHRQSRRQDDRFLGAAQSALRPPAQGPHQPLRSREARVARGRWRAADLQADQRRQEDRDDARRIQGRRATTTSTSRGPPTSRGCPTARSSSPTATRTRAS